MDTIFHGFLTYLIFRKKKYKYKAAFWGMAPDFFPVFALIYFVYLGKLNNLGLFNDFLYNDGVSVYLFFHSLTPYLFISLILFLLKKKQYWLPLAGGGLHILIDILTHSEGAVKIFYPFYPYEKLSFTAQYFSDENLVFIGVCWIVLLFIYYKTVKNKNMKKESLSIILKKRRSVLFLSAFTLIFPMLAFASAGDNISKYHLVGFAIITAISIITLFLFALINKNHMRKIENKKKLFLFGIIPCLIIAVLVLVASIISFLCVFRISFDTLSYLIMNFVNWTLGALFLYSILVVLVGIYFIFKKNKDMSYGFLKLGISIFGACLVIYGIIVMISSGPADYM